MTSAKTTTVKTTARPACKYPGCGQPAAPAEHPGRPPEYCAGRGHTRVSAWRERRRLTAEKNGTAISPADDASPVTMAKMTGAELLRSLRAEADRVSALGTALRDRIDVLADPTAAEAEVEAVRAAAEQRAATAEAKAADAERRAAQADQFRTEADAAAEQMSEELTAAQDRASAAEERAQAAEAARDAAVAKAKADADERIAAAGAERDDAIARVRADAGAKVRAAEADRDEARKKAAGAEAAAVGARQDIARAEAAAQAAQAETGRVRADAAQTLAEARADAAREREELRAAAPGLTRFLSMTCSPAGHWPEGSVFRREASLMGAGDLTPEREEQIAADLLRERTGIDPGKVGPVADLAAIGLVNGAWRNTCVENWHAEGRLEDGDMLRASSHATWRVRQLIRRWMRDVGLDAAAPASALDDITAEEVWRLATRLYQWLASPVRKLPSGVTLAQLAGDGLAAYRDDADASLSTFAVLAQERGPRFAFARVAAHGGLACSHWWGHPHWPALVDQFMTALDNPASDYWGPGGEYKARLPAEPPDLADRARLRSLLLSRPWELSTDAA